MTMPALKENESISESVRERETFLHEPTLLSHIKYNDTGELLPTLELSNSADPILTALAQLGVCRTGASRAFISLFDKEYQYIIAEATQTSSLSPNLNNAKQPDRKLWLRGTAIPRTSGVCRRVLNTSKTDGVNHEVELPINKICDIREDPNLISNSCVLLGSAARGYVGVPIRSQNGVDFGEYCVVTEQPLKEDEWSEANSTFLREISQSVLEHLLSKTSQIARGRAGKMTRGMASFLEQRSTWVDWQQYWMNGPEKEAGTEKLADGIKDTTLRQNDDVSPKSMRPRLRPDSVSSHSGLSSANLLETGSHSGDTTGPPNGSVHRRPSPTAAQLQNSSASTDQDPLTIVFSRSAAIIQESIDADGVIFFDANAGVFNSFAQHCSVSDASDSDLSDDGLDPSPHVIASSTRDALSPETGTYTSNRLKMSFKALSAFLRRHPEGAIFDFDENGNPQPSNLPDNNSQPNCRVPDGRPKLVKPRTQSFTGNLASEISKTFLGARSVAFVPVLDQVKKRPRAGCFAYTCSKTRFFGKAEINFMLAFGPLAMAEIARLETDLANRALSDVLSSLSHELRSPLHGIVSAVDFLTETPLSVFQGNLLHILETSGRTLSDTVDHLLYYARVNNFKPPGDTPDTRPRGLRREMNCTLQEGMKDLTVPVHVDELVEEVTESMFAGFNFQRSSIGQLERDLRKSRPYIHAIRQDDTQTGEDSGWWRQEDQEASGYVVIDLAIDPSCSHYYYSISGAIRRIVMNLFGNALKYTRSGSIRVALSQERVQRRKHNIMPWAKIVVADTGKGISEDFLANHLFQDFCQEDSIEPGLGLGLCVVKKIVSSLKGKVSIESKVAVGTTATVLLPLQPIPNPQITPSPPQPALSEYAEQRKKLGGLRICIVGFNTPLKLPPSSSDVKQGTQAGDYQSIWEICRTDLAMQVVPVGHEGLAPDIVLCEERELHDPCVTRERLTKAPLVVLCTDTLSAYHLSSDPHFKDPSGVAEFISQPTGPRKLAKTLVAALQRWVERQDSAQSVDKLVSRTVSPQSISSNNRELRKMPPQPIVVPEAGIFVAEAADSEFRKSRPSLTIRSPPLSPRSVTPPRSPPAQTQTQGQGLGRNRNSSCSSASSPKPPTAQKFLLVEDNQLNMKILCTYMEKLGRNYDTAEDGQVAVDKYDDDRHHHQNKKYECILMDISMPRLDGLEATRQIRQFEATNRLEPATIIAISGLASAKVQQDAFQSGINLFLTKPVQFKEICGILKERGLL